MLLICLSQSNINCENKTLSELDSGQKADFFTYNQKQKTKNKKQKTNKQQQKMNKKFLKIAYSILRSFCATFNLILYRMYLLLETR